MERFLKLPPDKQKKIRDAGLRIFGSRGYGKTSIRDIADEAGTSKATIFHYVGIKKELYLYLLQYCDAVVRRVMKDANLTLTGDIIEQLIVLSELKASISHICPYLHRFAATALSETNEEVADAIHGFAAPGSLYHLLQEPDPPMPKLREDIDSGTVSSIIRWMTEGYISEVLHTGTDFQDNSIEKFHKALELLRSRLYKKEFL